jgi:hypothetical protein
VEGDRHSVKKRGDGINKGEPANSCACMCSQPAALLVLRAYVCVCILSTEPQIHVGRECRLIAFCSLLNAKQNSLSVRTRVKRDFETLSH